MLQEIEANHPEKIDSYAVVLERLKNEEAYLRSKAAQFEAVARGCKNAQEWLKTALKSAANEMGTNELKGIDSRFKITTSEPKVQFDVSRLSEEYYRTKETVVIEKIPKETKIAEDLKAGIEVEGACLKSTVTLRQYVNKSSGGQNAKRIN